MAKTKVSEFDVTPANNTDINSIDIAENCAPSGINNAIRALMSTLKKQDDGTDAMTSPDINGGTVDGAAINDTTIGATTASTGKFTTLEATTSLTMGAAAAVEADLQKLVDITTTATKIDNVADNYTGNDLDGDLGLKANLASPTFSGTVTSAPTFQIKNSDNTNYWTVTVDSDDTLHFAFNGGEKMKLTSGGDLSIQGDFVAVGDVTAKGTY